MPNDLRTFTEVSIPCKNARLSLVGLVKSFEECRSALWSKDALESADILGNDVSIFGFVSEESKCALDSEPLRYIARAKIRHEPFMVSWEFASAA